MKRAAVLVITLLAGCDLYWSHSGDDVVCPVYGGGAEGVPAQDYRDPTTGICNYYDNGGGGCTYDSNGCCQYYPSAGGALAPSYSGSTCDGSCEALGESDCVNTYGCHAEYGQQYAYPDVTDSAGNQVQFLGCWDIQPLTPIEGGQCQGLDAYTCAQHDDCVSIMNGYATGSGGGSAGGAGSGGTAVGSGGTYFSECAPETPVTACDGIDCGAGNHCEQQCYPSDPTTNGSGTMSSCGAVCVPDQSCATVDCGPGYSCAITCDPSSNVCYPACYPTGPTDPGECYGAITCNSAGPACPMGTTPGTANGCYTGYCIPETDCGPKDPGSCDPSGATCSSAPPVCPADTVPGVKNGCWSGYCIPSSACPVPACETLATEDACVARFDCTPVYTGTDCTCLPDGSCTCVSESFARCETLYATDPPVPQPGPFKAASTH